MSLEPVKALEHQISEASASAEPSGSGDEAGGSGFGGTIDVEVFLNINRLQTVLAVFKERAITIEELLPFSDTDLRSFAKEIGLDTLMANRLLKAVRNHQPQEIAVADVAIAAAAAAPAAAADAGNGQHNSIQSFEMPSSAQALLHNAEELPAGMAGMGMGMGMAMGMGVMDGDQRGIAAEAAEQSVHHVIISPEEHEAIQSIHERYDHTSNLVATIDSSFTNIDEAFKSCQQEINDKFEHLILQMKLRQEELLAECGDVCNEKKVKLKQQLAMLHAYRIQINDGKQEYERLISDTQIEMHKRRIQVLDLRGRVLTNEVALSLVSEPNMLFKCDPRDIGTFLSALKVDNCDRPSIPTLIVMNVTFDTMDIEWHTDFDSIHNISSSKALKSKSKSELNMLGRQPTEFQICYCKYKKESRKSAQKKRASLKSKNKSKSKNKNIKKKKKKKKKKRRRRRRSDSDDSDSDSDDSSASSSSSSDDSSRSDSDSSDSDTDSESDSDGASDSDDGRPNVVVKSQKVDDMKADEEFQEGNSVNNDGDDNNNNNYNEFMNVNLEHFRWKKIRIKSIKKKKLTVKKLEHGWLYLVRIRAKNSCGWSEFSTPVKVSTQTISLVWDTEYHGRGVTFVNESRLKFGSKQSKAVVDYKIRLKYHKTFSWEFKMHRISNHSWIGFVRGPVKRHVSNWNYFLGGNDQNEYSIGFGTGSMTINIQHVGAHNHGQTMPLQKAVRKGDRFKFKVHMKNNTCSVYHNSRLVGAVFQNIPTCVVPAASNNTSHSEITVSFAK